MTIKFLFKVLIIITPINVFCQKKIEENFLKKLDIETIETSSKEYFFRLITGNQSIEIWKDSNDYFEGELTNWTNEYVEDNEEPTNRVFIEKKKLDSIEILNLLSLINSSEINKIRGDNLIPEWKRKDYRGTYCIETLDSNRYIFKSYWTHFIGNSSSEVIHIHNFVDSALLLIKAQERWESFQSIVPFECYTDDHVIVCLETSKKQKRIYRKERKEYLKTLKN